ncbi:MAG: hypothetical protein ACE5KZ_09155 [Candidatus Scalinduaceae bacterium]
MSVRILLVCKKGSARQKYLDASKKLGARVDVVSSFKELFKVIVGMPYNGLMIDMLTKIRSHSDEKGRAQNIFEHYPVIQLTFDMKSGQIRTLYIGKVKGSGTLDNFITQQCCSFSARIIRSNLRRDINFNVILSKSKNVSSGDYEKTVIMNIDLGGCFIFSSSNWE